MTMEAVRDAIVRHMEERFVAEGYLYDGEVNPEYLAGARVVVGVGDYQLAYDALIALEGEGRITRRACQKPMSFMLPIERQAELIEQHNLRAGWEKRGACFNPNHEQLGAIPRILRKAGRLAVDGEPAASATP